jgi:ABC-type amino acid transport substrate-binding protein
MVKKGNPHHVTGLASLSGLRVAAQVGTVEKDALTALNKRVGFRNSVRGLTGGFGWWLDTFALP